MLTLSKEQRNLLELQTSRYQLNLYEASEYLEARGITEETAVLARLGVTDEELWSDQRTVGRLCIPYLTRAGVVCLRLRCLEHADCDEYECSKYLGGAGVPPRIYGVEHLVSAGGAVCVTEGELDALTLGQCGYSAVGVPGAQTWKPHWNRLFEDFTRIFVFCDGDAAGTKVEKAWVERFPQAVEIVRMPDGEDVNSMYLKEGSEYFDDILR